MLLKEWQQGQKASAQKHRPLPDGGQGSRGEAFQQSDAFIRGGGRQEGFWHASPHPHSRDRQNGGQTRIPLSKKQKDRQIVQMVAGLSPGGGGSSAPLSRADGERVMQQVRADGTGELTRRQHAELRHQLQQAGVQVTKAELAQLRRSKVGGGRKRLMGIPYEPGWFVAL